MSPAATVLITAFDRQASLQRLLLALNTQTTPPGTFEVIIADDSADVYIAEKVLQTTPVTYPIQVIRTGLPYTVNGVSVARNLGIKQATGAVIISIDDDCEPNRFFVEEHLKYHRPGLPLIVLGHRSELHHKLTENRPVTVTENKAMTEFILGSAGHLDFTKFMTGNISFPKDIALAAGLFNESFAQAGEHGSEDVEFGYRLWRSGYRIIFAPSALVYRPETEKEKEAKRENSQAMQKALIRFYALHPVVPDILTFLNLLYENKIGEAKALGTRIVEADPVNHGMLTKMGLIHLGAGEIDMAQTYLLRAERINPNQPQIPERLAEIAYRRGNGADTLKYLSRALALDPNRSRALYLLALIKAGCIKAGLKDPILGRAIHVELGGGVLPTRMREEGHDDYINLDIRNLTQVDITADFTKALPFQDASVRAIFSREMIEHLPFAVLPGFLAECHRILEPGGSMYLCCPDFEAITALKDKHCTCVTNGQADANCRRCHGQALLSEEYWRRSLLGDQQDYGDGGVNDTHKNQIWFGYLKGLLEAAGFMDIERDETNRFYEDYKKRIKLSVTCRKPDK